MRDGMDGARLSVSGLSCGLEALATLISHPDVPDGVASEMSEALVLVMDCCREILQRPSRLEVGAEHMTAAIRLTTALLDGGSGHRLMAEMLTEIDDAGVGDPSWRVAVMAALSQLVADALTMVVAGSGVLDDDAGVEELNTARRHLLSSIALIHQQHL